MIRIDDGARWDAACLCGGAPSFADGAPADLEVHAIDVALGESLYGARVEVHFATRLRSARSFAAQDELVRAIRADVDDARSRLAALPDGRAIASMRGGPDRRADPGPVCATPMGSGEVA
jgi:hypothetical protein